jgi:mannan endo-1,4-beta-mannosidase
MKIQMKKFFPFCLQTMFLTAAIMGGTSCVKNAIPVPVEPALASKSADQINPIANLTAGTSGNGANVQPAYYNSGNVNFGFSLMKQKTKIKTIRLEIDPHAFGFSINQAKTWVSSIKAQGYSLICTYHSFGGSDNVNDLKTAANWWKANYNALGGGFTINLCNEWGSHNISASSYASAYNQAISIVRQVYGGRIIIDIPGWGQETLTAYQACKTSNPRINDGNIILSTHIYPGNWNQGRNHTYQKSDMDDLSNSGRPVMVGEFGTGSGNCDWSGCVDYAKSKGWTVLAWSWNGDGNNLNMVSPSWASNPKATSFTTNSYFNTVYAKL